MSGFFYVPDVAPERGTLVAVAHVQAVRVVGYDGDWRVEYLLVGSAIRGRGYGVLDEALAERAAFLAAFLAAAGGDPAAEVPAAEVPASP